MVFIGQNLDGEFLTGMFNKCLATPENLRRKAVTLPSHCRYSAVTLPLHDRHIAVT